MTRPQLAKMIDHTLLKAEATRQQVADTIEFAGKESTAAVCLNPFWVPLAAQMLQGSGVAVCTVIGFPLGATATEIKVREAEWAARNGAAEIDMVLNVGLLKSGEERAVYEDIAAVAKESPLLKVILETCYLTEEEIAAACRLAADAGALYVKTSTGFGPAGATPAHIRLMCRSLPPGKKVKAAGGIGTLADAMAMIEAGASRIGASRTAAMLDALETY